MWAKTLLVITWDEHGGLFDHEKPQPAVPPKKMSTLGFKFDLTGVRVPTVLVSPWIRRGAVDHTVYDHASIPKSLRMRFAPKTKNLTDRDEKANSWWDANIWENAIRGDIPDIPEPQVPSAPMEMVDALAEPPIEDEEDLGWLVREIERVLDAKADGVPVKVAVKAKQPTVMANAPVFTTRAELAAYAQLVSEKIR